jgi:hypothetical protein
MKRINKQNIKKNFFLLDPLFRSDRSFIGWKNDHLASRLYMIIRKINLRSFGSTSEPVQGKPISNNELKINVTESQNLDPWFVSGFVDGEGSFVVILAKNDKLKSGWRVQAVFSIGLHGKDLALLKQIQTYFHGIGDIYHKKSDGSYQYTISNIKDIKDILIPHFENYPLITQKKADFILFKSVVELIIDKEHLSRAGVEKIVGLKASLNKGLPEGLKAAFPHVNSVPRPQVECQQISHPYWLAGFASGEGHFFVNTPKTDRGVQVQLRFSISQHSRDANLIKYLVEYLDCGVYCLRLDRKVVEFTVTKYSSQIEKIIPFFHKYPIVGVKSLDFSDFVKVANILKSKEGTLQSRIEQILRIKGGMNSKREIN